jgi:hypothetical protein
MIEHQQVQDDGSEILHDKLINEGGEDMVRKFVLTMVGHICEERGPIELQKVEITDVADLTVDRTETFCKALAAVAAWILMTTTPDGGTIKDILDGMVRNAKNQRRKAK